MKTQNLFRGVLILFSVFYLTPLFAQTESKVAIITVSGSGKTQDEAKQNALRNAIEQAFGTFISSNTQILNDELIKDEIVSVSSGNIQEYTVLSEVQTSDGYWSNTVKAKVAIDKLTSFCESKGVNVEFKGALFSLNVKQQILNEENEKSAIKNMCKVLKDISEKSFDYQISAEEPTSLGNNNNWKIPITITATTNANFKTMSDYLLATLTGISLTPEEVSNYSKLGKDYKTIVLCPLGYEPQARNKKSKKSETINYSSKLIYLRNDESLNALHDFIAFFKKSLLNFAVANEIRNIQGEDLLNFYYLELKSSNFYPVYSKAGGGGYGLYKVYNREIYKPSKDVDFNTWCKLNELSFGDPQYYSDSRFFPFLAEINENSVLGKYGQIDLVISFWLFNSGYTAAILSYEDKLTLDQLSKISGYKITPRIGGSEVDQDGNIFKTAYVGSQRWMAQDLNVTHFSNGDPIQGILYREPEKWIASKDAAYTIMISGSYYKVYNWHTIADNRNVCPSGWHVPSEAEWDILVDFLGGTEIAGGKLKAIKDERSNNYLWNNPNKNDINEFNFSSEPNDYRDGWGEVHYNDGTNAIYWIKTNLNSSNSGKSAIISNDASKLTIGSANAHSGLAIRCIKD